MATASPNPPPRDALSFPPSSRALLDPHLPSADNTSSDAALPFVTLTFATSLDSSLALAPGTQTALSGPESKAMTHYLRSRHDAILIGVGTAVADNPSLNCRIEGVGGYGGEGLKGQPRPIVIDPDVRWDFAAGGQLAKVLQLAKEGKGRAPWVVISHQVDFPVGKERVLEQLGGKLVTVRPTILSQGRRMLDWEDVFHALKDEGIRSVMVEGGGAVINTLLRPQYEKLISSVIVTIAPTWLGRGGVVVSPERPTDARWGSSPAVRLKDAVWHPFGEDVVLCGKIRLHDEDG